VRDPSLPARRPRISREFLEEHRRRRYVDAVAELLHEFSRDDLSVANIVRLAATSRNSFYEVFSSSEDCIAYGIGLAVGELFATIETQDGEGEWLSEVDDAIAGFYRAVAAEPLLAELFLIHSAASRVEHGRAAALTGAERFTRLLGRGRTGAEACGRGILPASAEEYFSRAIVALAARRVRGKVEGLPAESRGMTALIGGFYLGSEAVDQLLPSPTAEPVPS
jgi:AcrR family transcriptional regulator